MNIDRERNKKADKENEKNMIEEKKREGGQRGRGGGRVVLRRSRGEKKLQ